MIVCAGFLITTCTLLWNEFLTMHICVEGMEDKLYTEYWCLGGVIYPIFMELSFPCMIFLEIHTAVYIITMQETRTSLQGHISVDIKLSYKCTHSLWSMTLLWCLKRGGGMMLLFFLVALDMVYCLMFQIWHCCWEIYSSDIIDK